MILTLIDPETRALVEGVTGVSLPDERSPAFFKALDDLESRFPALYVQVMDPELFGGSQAFLRQTTFMAAACRNNPPAPGIDAVRLPGDAALARKAKALGNGVALYPGILDAMELWAATFGIQQPEPMR